MFFIQKLSGITYAPVYLPERDHENVYKSIILHWKLSPARRHDILVKQQIPLTFQDSDKAEKISGKMYVLENDELSKLFKVFQSDKSMPHTSTNQDLKEIRAVYLLLRKAVEKAPEPQPEEDMVVQDSHKILSFEHA